MVIQNAMVRGMRLKFGDFRFQVCEAYKSSVPWKLIIRISVVTYVGVNRASQR
jgi:hypothetical protein